MEPSKPNSRICVGLLLLLAPSFAAEPKPLPQKAPPPPERVLFVPVRVPPADTVNATLFGLPYASAETTVVESTPIKQPIQSKARGSAPAAPAANHASGGRKAPVQPEPLLKKPENLDYGRALQLAPIEMIMSDCLVIDGKIIPIGGAFALDVGLDFLSNQRAAEGEDVPRIHCVFRVLELNTEEATAVLQVMPQGEYPPLDQIISFRFRTSKKRP